jgi:glycosyltransferase involved in cell wall biosynthesis
LVLASDSPGHPVSAAIEGIANAHTRAQLIRCQQAMNWAERANAGLKERSGDVVIATDALPVTEGWLTELIEVAYSDERTACVAPLNDDRGACSLGEWGVPGATHPVDDSAVVAACRDLPRWTAVPRLESPCVYLRAEMIDAVGLLDPAFQSALDALDDWAMRAQSLGLLARRANRVFIRRHARTRNRGGRSRDRSRSSRKLLGTYPHLSHQCAAFRGTLDARLATHAVQLESTGRLRLALDLRHLPPQQVGTRTYALCLARELARLPQVDLTLIVREPSQAPGLKARLITADRWCDDVDVIHKPAQIFYREHAALLFESSAHVVITYQDLIAHRISLVFPGEADFDDYRATNRLCVPAAQRILAYSHHTAGEIAAEFGIPRHEVVATPLGVDVPSFSRDDPQADRILARLRLPARYFFCLATDYPHKNMSALLEAYVLLRQRWSDTAVPSLILAGHALNHRTVAKGALGGAHSRIGVRFLGAVSADELRILYQRAEALVFPSLYEGFGLPPLEAMAAGTPVIALPVSAIPEVCGDSVLYPEGLSVEHLARAMHQLAGSDALRAELRRRGRERVEQFTWEKTARATLEACRDAVLRPSERSLQARRLLRDAIVSWSRRVPPRQNLRFVAHASEPGAGEALGIRSACAALKGAVVRRLNRELKRLSASQRLDHG